MKTKLSLAVSMALASSLRVSAADYETAQQLRDGDLLSADVLNDILERIELSLKPITGAELAGSWTVTQYRCGKDGWRDCADGLLEKDSFTWDSDFDIPVGTPNSYNDQFSNWSLGMRQFDLDITEAGADKFSFNSAREVVWHPANGVDWTGEWSCRVLRGAFVLCHKSNDLQYRVTFDIQRTSPNQFRLVDDKTTDGTAINVLVLDKVEGVPTGPTRLISANAANGNKLTWQDNSNDETAFVIKRKSSIDAAYAELATAGANVVTFTDTAVTQDATYWYRVGARNASGDSLYSNAVRHKTNTVTSN